MKEKSRELDIDHKAGSSNEIEEYLKLRRESEEKLAPIPGIKTEKKTDRDFIISIDAQLETLRKDLYHLDGPGKDIRHKNLMALRRILAELSEQYKDRLHLEVIAKLSEMSDYEQLAKEMMRFGVNENYIVNNTTRSFTLTDGIEKKIRADTAAMTLEVSRELVADKKLGIIELNQAVKERIGKDRRADSFLFGGLNLFGDLNEYSLIDPVYWEGRKVEDILAEADLYGQHSEEIKRDIELFREGYDQVKSCNEAYDFLLQLANNALPLRLRYSLAYSFAKKFRYKAWSCIDKKGNIGLKISFLKDVQGNSIHTFSFGNITNECPQGLLWEVPFSAAKNWYLEQVRQITDKKFPWWKFWGRKQARDEDRLALLHRMIGPRDLSSLSEGEFKRFKDMETCMFKAVSELGESQKFSKFIEMGNDDLN